MRDGRVLSVATLFNILLHYVKAWDIAVAVGNHIHFLNSTGTQVGVVSESLYQLEALAYNMELHKMYFSDTRHPEGSVFEFSVPQTYTDFNWTVKVSPVVAKQVDSVKGIAYDHMTGTLYWSNGWSRAIMVARVESDRPQAGQRLLRLPDQIPMGLSINICQRYLYWSNCGSPATIERSLLDGTEHRTLVSGDMGLPISVVVDPETERIYWVDERLDSNEFRIESADKDGMDRRVVISGSSHQPYALSLSAGSVFWADHIHQSVWRLPLDNLHSPPVVVASYSSTPDSLVASNSGSWTSDKCKKVVQPEMRVIPAMKTTVMPGETTDDRNSSNKCLHNGTWIESGQYCNCRTGFSGRLCEVDDCLDYCVQGECVLVDDVRSCRCSEGYTGARCEVYKCHNYCVTGSCTIDSSTGQPQCHCKEGYSGERCDVNYTQQQELKDRLHEVCTMFCRLWSYKEKIQPFEACNCEGLPLVKEGALGSGSPALVDPDRWDYVQAVLLAFCALLTVIVAVLAKKVLVLRKRPRIKKRIIVNKSTTPLQCRPSGGDGDEQCEITIENCCNMNICETPCFEPDFRTPQGATGKSNSKGKDREKETLLGHMELPPDDLY